MLRFPVLSPALKDDLMRPPTREELDRMGVGPAGGDLVGDDDGEEGEEGEGALTSAAGGGIGMLDGNPVFGPPRPCKSSGRHVLQRALSKADRLIGILGSREMHDEQSSTNGC
jgi:hypothetical protein